MDHYAAHIRIVVEILERFDKLDHKLQVQRVEHFGTVELDGRCKTFQAGDDDILRHTVEALLTRCKS